MVSIRKPILYIKITVASGMAALNATTKTRLTILITKQWMTYEKTKERSKQITDAGYNLIEMWECEWVKSTDYRSAIKTLITLLNL